MNPFRVWTLAICVCGIILIWACSSSSSDEDSAKIDWTEVDCVEDCADAHIGIDDGYEACVEENCPVDLSGDRVPLSGAPAGLCWQEFVGPYSTQRSCIKNAKGSGRSCRECCEQMHWTAVCPSECVSLMHEQFIWCDLMFEEPE